MTTGTTKCDTINYYDDEVHKSLILVFYISINNIRTIDIDEYVDKIMKKITPISIKAECIFIPVESETRIECINPKYITDTDLIRKHRLLMDELHVKLTDQIKLLDKNA